MLTFIKQQPPLDLQKYYALMRMIDDCHRKTAAEVQRYRLVASPLRRDRLSRNPAAAPPS